MPRKAMGGAALMNAQPSYTKSDADPSEDPVISPLVSTAADTGAGQV